MPVIRPANRAKPSEGLREPLTAALFKELKGGIAPRGPIVFEMPSGKDGRIDVIVVWDAWEALPPDERMMIIHDAYDRYSRALHEAVHSINPSEGPPESIGPRRTLTVIGATRQEVFSEGLLTFVVLPRFEEGEKFDELLARHLMLEAGGIETGTGVQLRLPTAELAADALAHLSDVMPEAHWAVVEEPSLYED